MACGAPHLYTNINEQKIKLIMDTLQKSGADITGKNPWNVDTNNHGIRLLGNWNALSSTLSVEVTHKSFFVPCSKIWEFLDPMIQKIANSDIA